jgi:hypothetical protein
MMAWIDADFDAHSPPDLIYYRGLGGWFMLVNRSIEYVAQSAHRLCQQFNATTGLRDCLANQHATFSGVRMNKILTQSFLDTRFKAVMEQERGNSIA